MVIDHNLTRFGLPISSIYPFGGELRADQTLLFHDRKPLWSKTIITGFPPFFLCDEELRAEIEKAKELFYAAKLEDEDLI